MELTINAEKTCCGCVFAVRKNGGVLYCANGKAFKPGTEIVWEAERIIEARGTCNSWHKAFATSPAAPKKPTRKKPKTPARIEKPATITAQPALFEVAT